MSPEVEVTDDRVARFGPYEFDFGEMVLRRAGQPVPLQPQPTQILATLLEKPGRLVSREDLRARVWGNRIVEFDPALNFCINQVRRALGDSASSPEHLETVHRRGYRFIAHVEFTVRERRRPTTSRLGPRFWALATAIAAGGAVAVIGLRPPDQDDSLTSLPSAVQSTYRAAQWLYEQGEAARALVRLDSVRLAAPDFAEAWAMTSHARLIGNDLVGARTAAERAIALDSGLADAYYALGRTEFFEVREHEAVVALESAVRLAPREIKYRQWYAETLANQLRFDEAIAQLEEARRIDPISNLVGVDLAMIYIAADRLDDAVSYCEASLELVKDAERWARDCLMTAYHFRDDEQPAIEHAKGLMGLGGATPDAVAAVVTLEDYFWWDLARIDGLTAAGESLSPFERVRATARLQDRDGTLRGLRSLRAARHFSIQWAPRDAWFRFLFADPEFQAILREAGLPGRSS